MFEIAFCSEGFRERVPKEIIHRSQGCWIWAQPIPIQNSLSADTSIFYRIIFIRWELQELWNHFPFINFFFPPWILREMLNNQGTLWAAEPCPDRWAHQGRSHFNEQEEIFFQIIFGIIQVFKRQHLWWNIFQKCVLGNHWVRAPFSAQKKKKTLQEEAFDVSLLPFSCSICSGIPCCVFTGTNNKLPKAPRSRGTACGVVFHPSNHGEHKLVKSPVPFIPLIGFPKRKRFSLSSFWAPWVWMQPHHPWKRSNKPHKSGLHWNVRSKTSEQTWSFVVHPSRCFHVPVPKFPLGYAKSNAFFANRFSSFPGTLRAA